MVRYCGPGKTAYDVGANYGIHSLLMARLVGTHGHVYAFEPVPEIFRSLCENIRLNRFANVTCVEQAVSAKIGQFIFVLGREHATGHLVKQPDTALQSITVTTTTLDDYIIGQDNRPPDFIKIDVEGEEGAVMEGAQTTIERFRPVLMIELHTPEQDLAVGRWLAKLGYRALRTSNGHAVLDLTQGWPAPDGIWGKVIARKNV